MGVGIIASAHVDVTGPTLALTNKGQASQNSSGPLNPIRQTTPATTPLAGSTQALVVMFDGLNGTGGSTDATFTVTDTWGDTGGGAWTRRVQAARGNVASGGYVERLEIWTRLIGTGPVSGTVTVNVTIGASNTTSDGWLWLNLLEVVPTGGAVVIGTSTGTTGRIAAGPTSLTSTLLAAPAASSIVLLAIHGDNTSADSVEPTGYSELEKKTVTAPLHVNSAYRNGGASTSATWTGLDSASNYIASGLELKVA